MGADGPRTLGSRAAILAAIAIATVLVPPLTATASPPPGRPTALTFDVRSGAVAIDRDGNAFVAGFRVLDDAIAVIEKLDPDGVPIWTRTWSQPQAHATGDEVVVAPDGSVYLAGTVGSNHFEGGGWFLRKYDGDGTLLWSRDEPGWQRGQTSDRTSGLAVSGGAVLLAGSFSGCCGDFRQRDGWVLAFGASGRRLWRNAFEPGGDLNGFSDEAEAIVAGPGGGSYVGGWTALGPESEERVASHELLLQELDPAGNVVWSRTYPSVAARDQDFGVDLALHRRTLMVSALVAGHQVQLRARPGHAWLGRFTLSGEPIWWRTWGRSWTRAAEPSAVVVDRKGRIFVVGTRRDASDHGLDGFLRAFSPSGRALWDRRLHVGRRFVVGADVAVRSRTVIATTEALDARYGEGVAGSLWRLDLA